MGSHDHGDEQNSAYILPESASFGNAGHESADKWTPGNPPGPVEYRPPSQPTGLFYRIRPETHEQEILKIITDCGYGHIQQPAGRSEQQNESAHTNPEPDIEHAQILDSSLDPGYRRQYVSGNNDQ